MAFVDLTLLNEPFAEKDNAMELWLGENCYRRQDLNLQPPNLAKMFVLVMVFLIIDLLSFFYACLKTTYPPIAVTFLIMKAKMLWPKHKLDVKAYSCLTKLFISNLLCFQKF